MPLSNPSFRFRAWRRILGRMSFRAERGILSVPVEGPVGVRLGFGLYIAALIGVVPTHAVAAQGASLPLSLELRVPKPPTVATAENGSFLAYELHITSFTPQPLTLKKVDVSTSSGDQHVLLSLTDSVLVRAVARPGVSLAGAERLKMSGGTRAVVYIWVPVDARTAPTSLQNRVT